MATEIKNAFDGLINKWDTAEERTCNLKDAPKKLPKLKSKENKKKTGKNTQLQNRKFATTIIWNTQNRNTHNGNTGRKRNK